jgi:altronate dehydratase small subunit
MTRVIKLHPTDNVATAVEDIPAGAKLELTGENVVTSEAIPFGHKVALKPIRSGEPILKYGEPIGLALSEIPLGACIHVHNVDSQRGRGDRGVKR